jgi:signal transduction histidine kinase
VCAAAGLWVIWAAATVESTDLRTVAFVLPIAAVTGRITIPMPRGGFLNGHTLVYLPAVLLLPTPVVVLIAFGGMVASQLWARAPWFKVAFNASQSVLSRGAASLVWVWLIGGTLSDPHDLLAHLPAVGAAGAVYFAVNGVLISTVLALQQGGRPWETWRANKSGVLLPQLGMYFMATLFAGAWLYDPRVILLLVVPTAVIWSSFRQIRALEAKTESEQALREQSERLAARWETLARVSAQLGECVGPDAVLRTAVQLVVAHCADAARVGTGTRSAELVRGDAPSGLLDGSACAQRLPLRVGGTEVGVLEAAWRAGAPNAEEAALLDQLGDRIAVELENALLLEQGAEVEAVREVARLKDEFLSAVSHELRSPLALLIGYGELLQERPPGEDEVRWMGERIHRAGEHLARLVDDLLEAGRLESGRFSLDRRRLDPLAAARSAVESAAATHASHTFELREAAGAPIVLADATRLQQVLTNLLANAARYAPACGRVSVVLEREPGVLVIAVEDEGPGVPPAERAKVFEKFYRTADAQQQSKKGLGLGLAICRDLVVAHGGRIWVEDAPSGGARFAFTLPLADA